MTRALLIVVALAALAFPAGALARKNAWQYSAASGRYEYHATATNPISCNSGRSSEGGTVLSRDYTLSWHGASFPAYQYAAKYFPVFRGPQTNGPGQKVNIAGQATISEAYRVFTDTTDADGNSLCTQQDQTCTKSLPLRTARFMIGIGHRSFRSPLRLTWNVDFTPQIPDCTPSELRGGLLPVNQAGPGGKVISKASNRQFGHRHASFSIRGSGPVGAGLGFAGTASYSAKATFKKVVIPDGCADRKPQHQFVCTNP